MTEEKIPKDLTCFIYRPERKLVQITIVARIRPEPGIVTEISTIISQLNTRILSLTLTSREDKRYITAILDMTESKHNVKELVNQLKQLDFIEEIKYLEPDYKGLLIDKHCFPVEMMEGKIRALIIPTKTLSQIFAELWKEVGAIAWVISFHQGYVLGEYLAQLIKNMVPDPLGQAKTLSALYRACGWGIMDMTYFNPLTLSLRVKIEENFEPEAFSPMKEPVCHFTRGLFAGATKVIWGREFIVTETKCKAMGDPHCEFIIRKK